MKTHRYCHHAQMFQDNDQERGEPEERQDQYANRREQELDNVGVGHSRGSGAPHQDRQQAGSPREAEDRDCALEDDLEPDQGDE